jgi:uncharacterized protein YidB (DUF937 family)
MAMGLLDQVLGSVLGAGQGSTGAPQQGSSTMSPVVKSLLLLLAAKAYQHYTAPRPQQETVDVPDSPPAGPGQQTAGGLGGDLAGGLGGLLGGLAGAGGLDTILDQFRKMGQGEAVDSWVGRGENQRIAPHQVADALGPEAVEELERQTGLQRNDVLSELSRMIPEAVDHFTPNGRTPTRAELRSWA